MPVILGFFPHFEDFPHFTKIPACIYKVFHKPQPPGKKAVPSRRSGILMTPFPRARGVKYPNHNTQTKKPSAKNG